MKTTLLTAGALCLVAAPGFSQGADDCAAADDLMSMLGSFPFDTNNCSDTMTTATTSAEQQCFSLTEDVWFRWTAPMALDGHIVRFDTCNTANYDTEIGIWEGANCGTAIALGCNDDSGGCAGLTSLFDATVTGGETYLIQLGYWSSAGGVFGSGTLQISDQGTDPCSAGIDDGFEDNDVCGQAAPLGASSNPGLFVSPTDEDYYAITVNPGDRLDVTAIFSDAQADVDIFLYASVADCQGADPVNCTGSLVCGFSASDNEAINWSNASAAPVTYILKVRIFSAGSLNCNNYDLDIAIGPDPCLQTGLDDGFEENDDCVSPVPIPNGMNANLFVAKPDPDHYTVMVPNGATVTANATFLHSNGDIDMALFEGPASCQSGAAIGFSGSVSDVETIMLTNMTGADATWTLQVFVFGGSTTDCNNYDLEISLDFGGLGQSYCAVNANSAGTTALVRANGSDVAANQDLTLITDGVVPGVPGLYFFGPSQIQVVFGDGFRCVGGQTTRIQPPVPANGMGTTTAVLNFAAPYGANITSGANLNFQLWYRDPMAGMAGFNLSNGLNIAFQ